MAPNLFVLLLYTRLYLLLTTKLDPIVSMLCCSITQANYGKQYESFEEEQRRQEIFLGNLRQIEEHNKRFQRGEVSFDLAVNKFADLVSTYTQFTMSKGEPFPRRILSNIHVLGLPNLNNVTQSMIPVNIFLLIIFSVSPLHFLEVIMQIFKTGMQECRN